MVEEVLPALEQPLANLMGETPSQAGLRISNTLRNQRPITPYITVEERTML